MTLENCFLRFDLDPESLKAELCFKATGDRFALDIGGTGGAQVGVPCPSVPTAIDSCGRLVRHEIRNGAITLRFDKDGVLYEGGFELDNDTPDLIAFVRPVDFNAKAVLKSAFPGALAPLQKEKLKYLIPIQQGVLMEEGEARGLEVKGGVEQEGEALVEQMRRGVGADFSGVPLTLQSYFWGVLGERSSFMAILDTFWDVAVQFDGGRLSRPIWKPSLGHLRYERRIRYRFLKTNSYAAVAKEYRRHLEKLGWIKTLKEKAAERPMLNQALGGCYLFFGYPEDDQADYLGVLRRLKAMGLEKAFCSSLFTYCPGKGNSLLEGIPNLDLRHRAAEVKALGYLFGAFANLGLISTANPDYNERSLLKGFDGGKVFGWKCRELIFHERCRTLLAYENIKTEDLFEGVDLIDLDQSIGWDRECYDPVHPHDKRMALEALKTVFSRMLGRGQILMGEAVAAWEIPYFDVMRTKRLPCVGAPLAWTGLPNKCWTVPLTQLMFHDCFMYTWWEGDSYDNPLNHPEVGGNPEIQAAQDALFGDPPMLQPVGGQLYTKNEEDARNLNFTYIRRDFNSPLTQRSIPLAVKVCEVTRKVATDKMLSHQFLDAVGWVQQTEFESGVSVIANFGEKTVQIESKTIPPNSWVAT